MPSLVKNKPATRRTWCWRRSIPPEQEEAWGERLREAGCLHWAAVEKPGRPRITLESYFAKQAEAVALAAAVGGRVTSLSTKSWLKPGTGKPIRIGAHLEIVHEKTKKPSAVPRLIIPCGMAFGSGEHGTTLMLLRAIAKRKTWEKMRVLDLGTGSGILALAARKLGATKIKGTDFDPEAIRTARENEDANFQQPFIEWQCADVRRLRAGRGYDLVVANLFSGILCEAAASITASLAPAGELLLSGILHWQDEEVAAAYRQQGLRLAESIKSGKWMMQHWQKV